MLFEFVEKLEMALWPQVVAPYINLACGPFAAVMVVLLFTYFNRYHLFHRLGIAFIVGGFAARFLGELGLFGGESSLAFLETIGVMILALIGTAKVAKKRPQGRDDLTAPDRQKRGAE